MIPLVQVAPGSISRGGDPTVDPSGLEMGTNRVRGRPIFTRMADEDHRRQCFLRGIGTLVQLFAYGLHKIPRGRGSSKGADDGHLPTINALIWSARFDKWMHL
jgi:hypothetical protein